MRFSYNKPSQLKSCYFTMNQLLGSFILFRKASVSSCFSPPLPNTWNVGPDCISASLMLKYVAVREFSKALYTLVGKAEAFLKQLAKCLVMARFMLLFTAMFLLCLPLEKQTRDHCFDKPGNAAPYLQHL